MISNSEMLKNGLALVPIPFGQKGPKNKDWNLRRNCVIAPLQLNALKGMNIGIAHAYCTPTPTCALDIDHYKNAKAWLNMHGIDLRAMLMADDAAVIWSGKKYSIKLLFRLPQGCLPLISKKIVGPEGKSALEFRCATIDGKTVQDVLPPSRHPDGHDYLWMSDDDTLKLPTISQRLVTVWQALIDNSSRVAHRRTNLSVSKCYRPETPRQIAIIQDALDHITADCDYERWRNFLWAILSTGWVCAEDLALAWSKTAPTRFEDDAYWELVNSYIPDHPNKITPGTIYHHARVGGWNV